MKRRGFTLIELLVVIAIIAILAAILFPVFAQAREKARQTSCASNLKQLSLAILMYVQDADETFPVGNIQELNAAGTADTGATWSWPAEIAPYVKSTAVFLCPDDPKAGVVDPTSGERISYGVNGYNWEQWGTGNPAHLTGPMGNGANKVDHNVWNGDSTGKGALQISQINLADQSILVYEVWSADYYAWSGWSYNYSAGGAYADVMYGNWPYLPTPGVGPGGWGTNGTNESVSAHQRGGGNTGGLSNFAFCDGHVKAMIPVNTHNGGTAGAAGLWSIGTAGAGNAVNMWDATRSDTGVPYQGYPN